MIALLNGRLHRKSPDFLIVDVSGVGYQVFTSLATLSSLPEAGGEVTLHIHTHVREDSLSLFGFGTTEEKELFLLLMGVSGIGPRLAITVLSSLSVSEICAAIAGGDDARLCSVPGIGKKTAGRLVLELKDKVHGLVSAPASTELGTFDARHLTDAVSALVNLGYKKPAAEEAIKRIQRDRVGLSFEQVIREALTVLGKR